MKLPKFYPILDTRLAAEAGFSMVDAAEAILEGGARLLQLRHKGDFSREVFEQAERIAGLCRAAHAWFVINDRADMAALLGAGLHLGQDDLSPADARKILPPGQMIGFSTHNRTQLEAAVSEPINYVALGPVFQTASKQNPYPVVGVEQLRRLKLLTSQPLVAIGGITRENAPSVWQAGADSVAVIGDLLAVAGGYAALRARTAEWCKLSENPHLS